MPMTTWVPRSRTARLLAVAGAAAVFAMTGAPSAAADSANHVAVCSSEEVSGVDVDNCVPNPNANTTTDEPGDYPEVLGSLVIGIG